MVDTTFRKKSEPTGETRAGEGKTPDSQPVVVEEVPYTDYENEHHHPYTVDHFKLGKYWDEGVGGFEKEVGLIEDYVKEKIKSGEWANDKKTIKAKLEKIEKITNMKEERRSVIKMAVISAHIKFLKEVDEIKTNFVKYGNN